MDTKGGRVSMTGNGITFIGRGAFKVMTTSVELENATNSDGSGYSTVKGVLPCLEGDFDRGDGVLWDDTMMLQSWNWTFVEDDTGVSHLFTSARFAGRPTLDTANGQVSGLKVETDKGNYQMLLPTG